MKRAAIIYQSKTGTTQAFAESVADFFKSRGIEARALSIDDARPQDFAEAEYVMLGCWTSGLLLLLQHPDKPWMSFARKLPALSARKIGLFTTYKVATGGMFKKMANCLGGNSTRVSLELKSRSKRLSESHQQALDAFLR